MKSYFSEYLPINLRRLRYFHMYPQKYIAGQLGISQAAYSKIERGKTRISEMHLNAIASVYGVEPFDLLDMPEAELIRRITVPPTY